MAKPTGRKSTRDGDGAWFGLGPVNFAILGLALVAIVAGYVLLAGGSITAAPLLLVLGYVVLLPVGLWVGSRSGGPEKGRHSRGE